LVLNFEIKDLIQIALTLPSLQAGPRSRRARRARHSGILSSSEQVVNLLTGIAKRAKIAGFDLAELMPASDIGGRGALVAARILSVEMGLVSRQLTPKQGG